MDSVRKRSWRDIEEEAFHLLHRFITLFMKICVLWVENGPTIILNLARLMLTESTIGTSPRHEMGGPPPLAPASESHCLLLIQIIYRSLRWPLLLGPNFQMKSFKISV